jgi:uncharacterized protein YjbJ (UPF0337 family)
MTHPRDKAQGLTKQIIGEMLGDDQLVQEGKAQQRAAAHPGATQQQPEPKKPADG